MLQSMIPLHKNLPNIAARTKAKYKYYSIRAYFTTVISNLARQ